MSARNRNTARKPTPLKAVPANADHGAPDPTVTLKTASDIASNLGSDSMDLHTFFRTIMRLTYSENGEVKDCEVHTVAEHGAQLALELSDALDQLHLDLYHGKVTQPAREVEHG
jgi:hypothetical protein